MKIFEFGDTFKYLCEKLRPHIEKETTRLRYPISVELRVAVTHCGF